MGARGRLGRDRYPALAFLASLLLAFALWEWYARRFWFVGDEWAFLVRNRLTTADGAEVFLRTLVLPHNEHWSTLPRLWYWLADDIWGLRTYTPYVTAVILLHLAVAVLVWLVVRRTGANAWLAAGAGALMALLGPGGENVFWGFQVGFVGSALFGFAAILLADHPGSDRRRDVLAGLAGLASLMCSGIGIPFVAALGVSVLFRRGWRPAAVLVAPLAAVFAVWYVAFGRANEANSIPTAGPSQWPPYISTQTTNALEQISQFPMLGGLIVLAIIVWVGFHVAGDYRARSPLAPVYGLLGGAVVLSVTTALGRAALGADQARASRYVYLLGVLLIPLLAVMLDSLLRRERRMAVPIGIVLVIAIAGSAAAIPRFAFDQGEKVTQQRNEILAAALDPLVAGNAPDAHLPSSALSPDVSLGALRVRAAAGDLPTTWHPSDADVDAARARALIGTYPVAAGSAVAPGSLELTAVRTLEREDGCVDLIAIEPGGSAIYDTGTTGRGVVLLPAPDRVALAVAFAADPARPVPVGLPPGQLTEVSAALPMSLVFAFASAGSAVAVCGAS